MSPNPNPTNPLPTWAHPTDEHHLQKADGDTPTQRKLHTWPTLQGTPRRILPPTTQCAATARQGPHTTPPQPPPTSPTGQTPPCFCFFSFFIIERSLKNPS
ncbi:hypothetical protein ILYODFUR_030674 [Ilyodon furcidens]|uniref:Uncharacterized protein n=1 Tax=Ilyodon furcidens TaxID=33524 RepID=A0ABV0V868_9TELE